MISFKRPYFRVEEIIGVENTIIEFDGTIWHIFRIFPEILEYGRPKREVLFAATSLSDCELWAQKHFLTDKAIDNEQ